MAEPAWPRSVELSAHLSDLQSGQQKLRIPAPVVVLAAELLKKAPRRAAVRNASELVAALLVHASRDPEALGEIVGDYRETRVFEVLGTDQQEGLYELPPRSEIDLA